MIWWAEYKTEDPANLGIVFERGQSELIPCSAEVHCWLTEQFSWHVLEAFQYSWSCESFKSLEWCLRASSLHPPLCLRPMLFIIVFEVRFISSLVSWSAWKTPFRWWHILFTCCTTRLYARHTKSTSDLGQARKKQLQSNSFVKLMPIPNHRPSIVFQGVYATDMRMRAPVWALVCHELLLAECCRLLCKVKASVGALSALLKPGVFISRWSWYTHLMLSNLQ